MPSSMFWLLVSPEGGPGASAFVFGLHLGIGGEEILDRRDEGLPPAGRAFSALGFDLLTENPSFPAVSCGRGACVSWEPETSNLDCMGSVLSLARSRRLMVSAPRTWTWVTVSGSRVAAWPSQNWAQWGKDVIFSTREAALQHAIRMVRVGMRNAAGRDRRLSALMMGGQFGMFRTSRST